jgi:phosphoglycerate dehydrogenase-like enzyme
MSDFACSVKVHIQYGPKPEHLAILREHLHPDIQLTIGDPPPQPADFDILVHGFPEREDILASPKLRALVVPWAGVPQETLDLMQAFPNISIHSLHYNSGPTAEMAMALLLAAAKRIVPFDRNFRRHSWASPFQDAHGVLLEGKTALILGYGRVGRRVASICRALGMHVIATRRHPEPAPPDEIYGPEALSALLPQANALILCVPHTPQTAGMIGEKELDLLLPDTVLVNVARGPIVQEEVLYRALKTRKLLAAGLDVWYRYPTQAERESGAAVPPSSFPFHELDNVVMSPHRAGWSEETEIFRSIHLAALLNTAACGKPLPDRIDPILGSQGSQQKRL